VQDFGERRQAIRGAGRIRNDRLARRQDLVVDAVDDGGVDVVAPGAEITTFLAPAVKCADALALLVKRPVHSRTKSTPSSPQGSFEGSRCATTRMRSPFTTIESPSTCTSPGNRPCTVSNRVRCAFRIGVAQVVDRDDFDLALELPFIERAQDVAADAAVAIDPHCDCHRLLTPYPMVLKPYEIKTLAIASDTRSGVKP